MLARGATVGVCVAAGRGVARSGSIGATSDEDGAATRPGVESMPTKLFDDGALTCGAGFGVAAGLASAGDALGIAAKEVPPAGEATSCTGAGAAFTPVSRASTSGSAGAAGEVATVEEAGARATSGGSIAATGRDEPPCDASVSDTDRYCARPDPIASLTSGAGACCAAA